ncbi:NADH-quinone oxidoreductase subunit M [Flavimobilis sp. GY10621]|uniref:NADH-quinone oxidoreductase subunit M n=1 Tax=Flavimobilis rhizosphaerae TaxID=2775421 RepID=A0ABR9DNK5_9MICO|nr:NADH-quinone oxidoreductase subunit M [Flavimobilis rhizosphaerae]MBD9698705.1 NADH-quinone oxidoreductase subunit M [Flavimobilis rhizosphaerae]
MESLVPENLTASFPWLTALVVVAALGAVALWCLPRGARGRVREIALGVSLVNVGLLVGAFTQFDTSKAGVHQLYEQYAWIPQIGTSYAVGVDGLGLALVALGVGLVPIVILAAWREQGDDVERLRHYLALVLLTAAFMTLIFAARDVFLFYVVFEAMLIPIYFMIGAFGGPQRRGAAVKFLLFSLAGGLVMLVAVIALFLQGPGGAEGFLTANLTGLALTTNVERLLFVGFFLAFAIKAPMFPVHTWLPDAAQQAPAGTSTLLVGVLDKVGTFGMLTLCIPLFPSASAWAAPTIVVLAVVSVIYGALLALGQKDLMRLIAYTSVSHFGVMILGIFAFSQTSIAGASFYMLGHGLATGLLFLTAGMVIARHPQRSQRIADFGGLQRTTPIIAGIFLLGGLATLSLPGLAPFVGEIMVLIGAFGAYPAAVIVSAVVVVLAALYILLTYQRMFTGPEQEHLTGLPDMVGREKWVVAPLVAALLVLGFYPRPALDLVEAPADVTVSTIALEGSAS